MISEIRQAFARGDGLRAISRNYGISKNTAKRYKPANGAALCLCGQPLHAGLCKERYAATPALVSYQRRCKGVDDGYRKPPRRSRQKEATAKFDFVFGREPGWEKRAVRPSEKEHYGIIGDVRLVTRHLKWDHREDVQHEMILACMEGRITRAEIPKMVTPFLMKEMKFYIGALNSIYYSLDAPAPYHPDSHRTFMDMMAEGELDEDALWKMPTQMWWQKQRTA